MSKATLCRKGYRNGAILRDDVTDYNEWEGEEDGWEGDDELRSGDAQQELLHFKQVCPICCSPKDTLIHLSKACKNHEPACRDCLRQIFVTQAQESLANYPLQCFHPECGSVVRHTQLTKHQLVNSKDELDRHYRLSELAKEIRQDAEVVYCTACSHPTSFRGGDLGQRREFWCKRCYSKVVVEPPFQGNNRLQPELHKGFLHCPQCRDRFRATGGLDRTHNCRKCGHVFYVASQRTVNALEACGLVGADSLCNGWCNGFGQCPSCKMFIIKEEGCDHMRCHCGHEFSWKKAVVGGRKLLQVLAALRK